MLGGPLYQLLLRAGLVQPSLELVHRRLVACAIVTWLPLAALTALAGTFMGRLVEVPFLFDLKSHIRYLVTLPLLIGAGLIVHR